MAERTLGRLMIRRRLVRDCEALPDRSEAMIYIAMIDLMTHRLTGENTPTWRGTRARNQTELTPLKWGPTPKSSYRQDLRTA